MNTLQNMNLHQLNNHIKSLVCSERQITNDVLKFISELDARRGYLELGYSSLFAYLTKEVGYSESAAQRRISAARIMNKVDSATQTFVCTKLKTGKLNLTHIAKVGSLIHTLEKKKEKSETINSKEILESVLPQLEGKDSLKSDQVIANILASIHPNEKSKTSTSKTTIKAREADGITLTLRLNSTQHDKLKKVLALKSHSVGPNDIVGLFEKLLDQELHKIQIKTKKIESQAESAQNYTIVAEAFENTKKDLKPGKINNNKKRKYISLHVKRRLMQKAGHQCQYISRITGKRCEEKHYLTIDHSLPLSMGGTDIETNFRILCKLHNLAEARRLGLFYKPEKLQI